LISIFLSNYLDEKEEKILFFSTRIFGDNGEPKETQVFKKLGKSLGQLSSLKVLKFKSTADLGNKKLGLLSRNWNHLNRVETLRIQYQFTGFKQNYFR